MFESEYLLLSQSATGRPSLSTTMLGFCLYHHITSVIVSGFCAYTGDKSQVGTVTIQPFIHFLLHSFVPTFLLDRNDSVSKVLKMS